MDTVTYCRNCGIKIVGLAEKCFKCRTDPLSGNAYCPGCGLPTKFFVKNCLTCGAPLSYIAPKTSIITPKSRNIAILLALSLGSITWLYTYKKDSRKFWPGLGLTIMGLIALSSSSNRVLGSLSLFGAPTGSSASLLLLMMISFIAVSGLWAWSLLDVMRKSKDWYTQYPNL